MQASVPGGDFPAIDYGYSPVGDRFTRFVAITDGDLIQQRHYFLPIPYFSTFSIARKRSVVIGWRVDWPYAKRTANQAVPLHTNRSWSTTFVVAAAGLIELFQDAQIPGPGHRLRPAVDPELAIDIAGVNLDRVQREE